MINNKTDNIECDVCGIDCGYHNEDGVMGFDRQGTHRDLCRDCADRFKVDTCAECRRIEFISRLDEGFECPKCQRERCPICRRK
jgi:hypothetical protein